VILEPVCTCDVPGILGCAVHTYGAPVLDTETELVVTIARTIASGGAFTDIDAMQVARAYLQEVDR
jgi:hypothetical protein